MPLDNRRAGIADEIAEVQRLVAALADRCERAERERDALREVVQALHDVAYKPYAEVRERWGFRSFGDAWDRLPAMARAALAGEAGA